MLSASSIKPGYNKFVLFFQNKVVEVDGTKVKLQVRIVDFNKGRDSFEKCQSILINILLIYHFPHKDAF